MKLRRYVHLLCAALFVAGCATGYTRGARFGYQDSRLQENVFSITFQGNSSTSAQRANDFAMLRAAELCLDHGYAYFVIAGTSAESSVSAYESRSGFSTTATVSTDGGSFYSALHTVASPTVYMPQQMPRASLVVVCYKERPQISGLVFDARFLAHSLRGQYGLMGDTP